MVFGFFSFFELVFLSWFLYLFFEFSFFEFFIFWLFSFLWVFLTFFWVFFHNDFFEFFLLKLSEILDLILYTFFSTCYAWKYCKMPNTWLHRQRACQRKSPQPPVAVWMSVCGEESPFINKVSKWTKWRRKWRNFWPTCWIATSKWTKYFATTQFPCR